MSPPFRPLFAAAALLALATCGKPDPSADNDASPNVPVDDGGNPIVDAAPMPDALAANCTAATGRAIRLEPFANGLSEPLYVTAPAGDPRVFIVEQTGRIRIVDETGTLLPTPFLDIEDDTRCCNERGLLGLAFHPDYATNGRFFTYSTPTNASGDTVLSEWSVSADPLRADATSEKRLLTIDQPFSNHNGGMIEFGPDGHLYVGVGDGGSADDPQGHGQNTTTLLATMLRLDVSTPGAYAIPADNPFANSADGPNDPRREIWAYGLRNPWRFSFDRMTGDLYIGDVGQNVWEEISFQAAGTAGGKNFGWKTAEGSHCFSPSSGCDMTGLVPPAIDFQHLGPQGDRTCSVTGGYVYRGACIPDLQGTYLYADYCKGEVWGFDVAAPSSDQTILADPGPGITSFGEDATGELYVVRGNGSVFKIVADSL